MTDRNQNIYMKNKEIGRKDSIYRKKQLGSYKLKIKNNPPLQSTIIID